MASLVLGHSRKLVHVGAMECNRAVSSADNPACACHRTSLDFVHRTLAGFPYLAPCGNIANISVLSALTLVWNGTVWDRDD